MGPAFGTKEYGVRKNNAALWTFALSDYAGSFSSGDGEVPGPVLLNRRTLKPYSPP